MFVGKNFMMAVKEEEKKKDSFSFSFKDYNIFQPN